MYLSVVEELVLRADGHETDTKHSFRSGGEHSQGGERWGGGGGGGGGRRVLVVGCKSQRKIKVGSFRLSNPFALHGLDTGGPIQSLQPPQQWLRVRNTQQSTHHTKLTQHTSHYPRKVNFTGFKGHDSQ